VGETEIWDPSHCAPVIEEVAKMNVYMEIGLDIA
jgi:hypothetical protein